MKRKLFILTLIAACTQLSCGGVEVDGELLEPHNEVHEPPTELVQSTWPDAADLGVVVFSEVVPLADPPPGPDLAR
jgi:hypothetical protein